MGWHTNSLPLPKEPDPNESKIFIRNLDGTDWDELKQKSYNGSFGYLDRLSFQVQKETEQTPVTVIKLTTAHTDLFIYQPNNYDRITSSDKSKSSRNGVTSILSIKIVGHWYSKKIP